MRLNPQLALITQFRETMGCLGFLKALEYKAQWWLTKLDHLSPKNLIEIGLAMKRSCEMNLISLELS
jgi:hypothetical protein